MDPGEVEETVEETVETATTTQRTKIASVAIKKGGVVERKGRQIDSFGRERNVTAEPESNSVSADGGHQRNRRLFGALMGHLSQAKQNLAKDSTLIEKRLAVESKRVAKQEQLNTTLCQLEREMIEAQRLKQTSQLRLDTLQTKKSEMVGVLDTWRAQTAPLAHVLMTETEPKLCWLPSTHNKTTQNLLNLRTAHVQAMIQTRETEEETVRAKIDTEIASLEAVLAATATNDDHNASEEDQLAASVTLSEYEARINKRRAEREPADLRDDLRTRNFGDAGEGVHNGYPGSSSSSSSDGVHRNGAGKSPLKSGQFAGGDLRELLGPKRSQGERRGHRSHQGRDIEIDENGRGGGRNGRGSETSGGGSGGNPRRVRQKLAEEGEELGDTDRGKEDEGGDQEGKDKEDGGGSPVYWSEAASAVDVVNRNDDSDEDVERYFEE